MPVFGDHTKTVAITIKGQTQFGIGGLQGMNHILQIFGMGGIRMMIRKMTIDLAKQFLHFTTQTTIQLAGKGTGHTITAIDDNLHAASELHATRDAFQIRCAYVMLLIAALTLSKAFVDDALIQLLYGLTINGLT